jgi:hypothetical protein
VTIFSDFDVVFSAGIITIHAKSASALSR